MSLLSRLRTSIHRHFVPSPDNGYRPHLLRRPWLLVFLAITLVTEGFLVANLIARESNQTFLAAVIPAEIIALTNQERVQNNVSQLSNNAELDAAAQAKTEDMATKDYFSHMSPNGETPWQWIAASGYQYEYAGENLAVRFINSSDVVNAWMASPTHRANIVEPVYTDIGVGAAEGDYEGQPATYVVEYFGTPATSSGAAAFTASSVSSILGQENSFTQSFARQLIRALGDPQIVSNWILITLGFVLIIALCATFFVHLQLQPTTMLMGGAMVAFFALSFLALNIMLADGSMPQVGQAASVGYALFP